MTNDKEQVSQLDPDMKVSEMNGNRIVWHNPINTPFEINGFAWFDQEKTFRRLPKSPEWKIPPAVDMLANHTSGGQIRFQTDSTVVAIKVKLRAKADMSHMPASGQCGFDCYLGPVGKKHFINVTKYDHTLQAYELPLLERKEKDVLEITLNFPLYQGVEEVFIGLNEHANIFAPPPYESKKKIILYGTSILQGGCASRPGMSYTNIISRNINMEFINLGFSGNGKGEASLANVIATIENPACLVLDYEPNCESTELYMATLPKFIRIYREKHPNVPIVVVSKFPYAREFANPDWEEERLKRLVFQKNLVHQLQAAGDQHITFFDGTNILGKYTNEGTVDGVHPTDLGFMCMAEKMEKVIRGIINLRHSTYN
ncbi:SGNH/GDSL hydrolase family protein [Sutcliffiella rhizosphaerae]|uniref:Hydrolase n=1 Tax=Sutcliffiella rhizosphaerae TaxID=2880967 RepID=A0ABN8ACI9_9BACI|nr:SGNH/GDSL hydrolase family protein [Sutcliffiella rhizosphaerae]CAG9621157.1 hypothetical protein BACCIP111883_01929 [Sutcliffiella rhizosphaerae]